MLKDPFTHQIIGLAMEAHRALGPGLIEEAYHQHLVVSLKKAGIEHLTKPRRDLVYRDHVADTFEADIVFPDKLAVELKSSRGGFDKEHFTQLLSYLKFWRIRTGMLFDFGKPGLTPKRVIYTSHASQLPELQPPSFVTDQEFAAKITAVANQVLRDVGLGYRETTWIGLMSAALRAEGIPFAVNPVVTLPNIGPVSLRCMVVAEQAALSITALGEEVTDIDRATLQTQLRWLNLPWGIAMHFGKSTSDLRYVTHPKEKNLRVL
jgi:GxxExxY protein